MTSNSSSSTSAAGHSHFWVKLLHSLSAEGTTDTGPTQPSHTGTSHGQIVLARYDEVCLSFFHPPNRLKPRKLSIILVVSLPTHPSKISPFYHHAVWQKCFGGDALDVSKDPQCVQSSFLNSSLHPGLRRQQQNLLIAIPMTPFLKLLK